VRQKLIFVSILIFFKFSSSLLAYPIDTIPSIITEEISITSRTGSYPSTVPSLNRMDSLELKRFIRNSTPELLSQQNIFVQKSQGGGGSPVIRGLEANRILLMVDGVRQNNAIFRGGHLHNLLRSDPFMIERMEVLQGSYSTLYGSDALGGVIQMQTIKPRFNQSKKFLQSVVSEYSTGTATNEHHIHSRISGGTKNFAMVLGGTFSKFGDIRQGENGRPSDFPEWGKRKIFQENNDQGDSSKISNNPDPNIQKGSEFTMMHFTGIFSYKHNHFIHRLNLQNSGILGNIPRYDRLSEIGSTGNPVWLLWNYDNERRSMVSYSLTYNSTTKLFDKATILASYQLQKETRNTRRLNDTAMVFQNEIVPAFSANLDFSKRVSRIFLNYGFEFWNNQVNSDAGTQRTLSNGSTRIISNPTLTRYPSQGSSMQQSSAYLESIIPLNKNINAEIGGRFTYGTLNTDFGNSPTRDFPFQNFSKTDQGTASKLGLKYSIQKFNIGILYSSGFRIPNIDDLAKIFESIPGVQIIVPNASLKSERSHTIELNTIIGRSNASNLRLSVFNTFLNNFITLGKGQVNGKDSLIFNGLKSPIFFQTNVDKGSIVGGEFMATFKSNFFNAYGGVSYSWGRITTNNVEGPLDHVPPLIWRAGINKQIKSFYFEFWSEGMAQKPIGEYRLKTEDNERYALPFGTPAWQTLNFQAQWNYKNYSIKASCENILDQNYRLFSSGLHQAGRNFRLNIRTQF
jgi:hemoglobin/transferrin/lactoferrin receptor protein